MIFYRRHSVFYRVWLNRKIFKRMPFFWRTPFFWPTPTTPKFWPMPPILQFYGPTPPIPQYQPTQPTPLKILWTHSNPRHPRQTLIQATHEPTLPTPLPMLFSRLITIIDQQLYYAIMRKALNGMSLISFIVGQEILINMTSFRNKFWSFVQ